MDTETIGKEDWEELQRNLEATIPVYDKVNRVATFGQVTKWRQMVRERLPEEGRVLEVGCGPGSFAEDVEGYDLVCLDPIPEMLRVAEESSKIRHALREVTGQLNLFRGRLKICRSMTRPSTQFAPCSLSGIGLTRERGFQRF